MHARDVMVAPVATGHAFHHGDGGRSAIPGKRICAAPVINSQEQLVGIVSKATSCNALRACTELHHSWWLKGFMGNG